MINYLNYDLFDFMMDYDNNQWFFSIIFIFEKKS